MNEPRTVRRWLDLLVQLFGGRYEWDIQTTDTSGSWRTWSDATDRDDAMVILKKVMASGNRWNPHMPDGAVKWRVERRIVWTRYYEPNAPGEPRRTDQ